MKYIVRTKYTVEPSPGLDTGTDSIVVPDDSLSIRDLLVRFSRGQPPAGTERPTIYDPDDNWDIAPENRQNADLSDIDELKEELYDTAAKELRKSAERRGRSKRAGNFEGFVSQSPSNNGENNQGGAQSNSPTPGTNTNEPS